MPFPTISKLSNELTCVEVNGVTVWYSYTTPVAFHVNGHTRVVHKNVWSKTTGKHLNMIDGGGNTAHRVDREEFERLWNEQTAPPVVTGGALRR